MSVDKWQERDAKVDRILRAVEKLDSRLDSIDVTLAKQAKDLEYHIYRTSLAEDAIKLLRDEVKPVQDHVKYMQGALKAVGVVAVITGCVSGLIGLLKVIGTF